MTTTQYVGARYVPLFKGEWDNTKTYEPLCIVSNQGNSYTSRQYVPAGIEIDNEEYWALTGNYNAQIEAYREETRANTRDIEKNTADISSVTRDIEKNTADISSVNKTIDSLRTNDPTYYGADPTGVNDSTASINACIKANAGKCVVFTPGVYKINSAIELPFKDAERVSVDFNYSTVNCTPSSPIDYAIGIGYTGAETVNSGTTKASFLQNLTLVCNSNVEFGVSINSYFLNEHVLNSNIMAKNGIKIGHSERPSDAFISDCFVRCNNASGIGIQVNGTDNVLENLRIYDFLTDIELNSASNVVNNVHMLDISAAAINGCGIALNSSHNRFNNAYFDNCGTCVRINKTLGYNYFYETYVYKYKENLNVTFIDLATNEACLSELVIEGIEFDLNSKFSGIKIPKTLPSGTQYLTKISVGNAVFVSNDYSIVNNYDFIKRGINPQPFYAVAGKYNEIGTIVFNSKYTKTASFLITRPSPNTANSSMWYVTVTNENNAAMQAHRVAGTATINFGLVKTFSAEGYTAYTMYIFGQNADTSIQQIGNGLGSFFIPAYWTVMNANTKDSVEIVATNWE